MILQFTDEVLMNGLYGDSEEWYNGNTVRDSNQGYVLHENKLLGVARLRTKKVRSSHYPVMYYQLLIDYYNLLT